MENEAEFVECPECSQDESFIGYNCKTCKNQGKIPKSCGCTSTEVSK